ncbi:MAG TPA: PHB depolymerase family esterase [Pyrinomonadaceae bacterium]|nr:PHB depolymerase family esterase [Pyrinomonadaceae bacterium]
MNRKTLTGILLALLLLSAQAQAADKISKESLDSHGRKRTYYLFVPDSVTGKTSVPLVVLLHGSGRNGLSLVEKWKELAGSQGFIIAGPDSGDSQGWRTPEDGPDFIHDLVEKLRAQYPINPRRVYLFGHSAGAVFALDLSMMESRYFAASAVHAGSWRLEEEFSFMDYAKRKLPLAIFVGDRDQFFSLSSVRATEAALKGRGFQIEVTVIKGHDHWYYDLAPDINRQVWDFLKKYELDAEPEYQAYNDTGGSSGEVNAEVKEINALRLKFNDSLSLFNAREKELGAKNSGSDKQAVAEIARAQIKIAMEGADLLRAVAEKSERLSKMKLKGNYPAYFSLLAESCRKRIEALAAMRERAEVLLGNDAPDTVTLKMNEAADRADKLNREADEMDRRAEQLIAGKNK